MAMVTPAHLAQAVREQVGPTLGAVLFGFLFEEMAERLVAGDPLRVGASGGGSASEHKGARRLRRVHLSGR